mmetsp:Transcript_54658/g.127244  ORF Transcript_54658/g.127244 Transcript_54658/m.127244 type:complete len:236 (-) Transcript_54658:77-784(-)
MDYSILIGMHSRTEPGPCHQGDGWRDPENPVGGIWSDDSTMLYFVGIIDFLIEYGFSKKGEHIFRIVQGHGQDASCVNPLFYARRQVRFLRDFVVAKPGANEDQGTLGTLIVQLLCANDLRKADLNGTSDPYVYVSLGMQRHRTHTVPKTCDPEWNCTVLFGLDEVHLESELEFEVWDEDLGALQGSDDLLGRLTVPVSLVIQQSPLELRDQVLKDVTQGRLSVRLLFQVSKYTL